VDPGDAYRIAEVPADLVIRHPLLEYAQTFRMDGARLVVRRDFLQRPGRLAPNQFGEWLDILRRIDLGEDGKVRLAPR
jgi:hypothetical protein